MESERLCERKITSIHQGIAYLWKVEKWNHNEYVNVSTYLYTLAAARI